MKTVTICGSMRYAAQMPGIALELELRHGFNVLQCVYNPENIPLSPEDVQVLSRAHLRKIDLSDAIYVVDIDGYIGQSVAEEIAYARERGKGVIFHREFKDGTTTWIR